MDSLSKYAIITLKSEKNKNLKLFIKENISTRNWIDIKRNGKIFLNDIQIEDINCEIKIGDKLDLHFKRRRPKTKFDFVDYSSLEIIYENDHILIVNKDYNVMSIESKNKNDFKILSSMVQSYLFKQGIVEPVHLVSRLDTDTSGCIIFAKDSYTHYKLSEQNTNNEMLKQYSCIVESNNIEKQIIEKPIARKEDSIIEREISDNGKYAKTEILSSQSLNNNLSLLKIKLHTGRTHQIRIHLKSLNAPIVGDFLYNNKNLHFRQLLHCETISFYDVENGEKITVNAKYKDDMEKFINENQ